MDSFTIGRVGRLGEAPLILLAYIALSYEPDPQWPARQSADPPPFAALHSVALVLLGLLGAPCEWDISRFMASAPILGPAAGKSGGNDAYSEAECD